MGEIVNLRTVRKRRAVAQAEQMAAENRVRHGRTAARKVADRDVEDRRNGLLDAARMVQDLSREGDGA